MTDKLILNLPYGKRHLSIDVQVVIIVTQLVVWSSGRREVQRLLTHSGRPSFSCGLHMQLNSERESPLSESGANNVQGPFMRRTLPRGFKASDRSIFWETSTSTTRRAPSIFGCVRQLRVMDLYRVHVQYCNAAALRSRVLMDSSTTTPCQAIPRSVYPSVRPSVAMDTDTTRMDGTFYE